METFGPIPALTRNADEDDANTRPCKRIKLETSELGTEADVTNIQKPQL